MNESSLNEALVFAGVKLSPFYTVADVEAITGLSRNTIYNHIYARHLPAVRLGRAVRIPAPALASFFSGGEQE